MVTAKKTKNSSGGEMFSFMDKFDAELNKMDGVGTSSLPPRYWYSTGNYVLNRIISGSYYNGIPQGRITDLAGPSGCLPAGETVSIYKMRTISGITAVTDVE